MLVKFAHAASPLPHGAYSCLTPRSLTSCTHFTTCRAQASLDTRSWIGEREKVLLLNQCTEVINYWQDENKHSLEEARKAFPNAKFQVRLRACSCLVLAGRQAQLPGDALMRPEHHDPRPALPPHPQGS